MIKRWVIVADTGICKILEQQENGALFHVYPNILLDEVPANKIRDKGSHPPEIAQGSRHLYEPRTPWHQIEEKNFCHEIAKILNHHYRDFDILTLVVSPKFYGILKKQLDKKTLDKIDKIIEKNLTKAPMKDIQDYIWPPRTVEAK